MKSTTLFRLACFAALALPTVTLSRAANPPNGTLLFDNLRAIGSSIGVDDPSVTADDSAEGPEGLTAADLDGDGQVDLVWVTCQPNLVRAANRISLPLRPGPARFSSAIS